jgi:hypothetical protein
MQLHYAFLLALLASPTAFACSCSPAESYEQQYAAASSVAVVRIVSAHLGNYTPETIYDEHGKVDKPEAAVLATAEVAEQIKGHLSSPSLIVSPQPGKPCYKAVEVGQTYVVFSSGDWPILHSWCNPLPLLEQIPPALLATWRGR